MSVCAQPHHPNKLTITINSLHLTTNLHLLDLDILHTFYVMFRKKNVSWLSETSVKHRPPLLGIPVTWNPMAASKVSDKLNLKLMNQVKVWREQFQ